MAVDYNVKNNGRDKDVALLKLRRLNVKIDKLAAEQKKYLASWEVGA